MTHSADGIPTAQVIDWLALQADLVGHQGVAQLVFERDPLRRRRRRLRGEGAEIDAVARRHEHGLSVGVDRLF